VPYQGLLENEGHVYHSWGLTHETKPAVYVQPISYADVQAVIADPIRFPSPVSPVGSMLSVTRTVVNDGGTLLCTLKLNEILGVETDAAGRRVVRVQAGCRLKELHLWLQTLGLEIPYQAEIGEATIGAVAAGDTKDSSLDGAGYFSAGVVAVTYVDDRGALVTLSDLVDEKALAEFKCSYGLSGVVVECLVEVRVARLCRSRFSVVTEESPGALGATIRRMREECDALFVTVALESLRALCDQRFSAGPGATTPAASQPVFDQMRLSRRLNIQHGDAPHPAAKPPPLTDEIIYARADLVNEYWRPNGDEPRLDFQYYEHDLSNVDRVIEESYAFTKAFRQEHGFAPHAWVVYFVHRLPAAKKPHGLYSGGPGISVSFDPIFSNPVDPLWQQFAKAYNQVAIHTLGGTPSPIQTQWLSPADLTIPRHLARARFTTKYYAQFLG
jgi:FAD/FMN-containing dehydrogenase